MGLWRAGLGLGLAAALAGCGAQAALGEIEDRVGVARGGLDQDLLGTFRRAFPDQPIAGGFELLVLKADLSFYGELAGEDLCAAPPCAPRVVVVEGQFRQLRDAANPTRAAGVVLDALVQDVQAGTGPTEMKMLLRRALIAGSPLVGLYHTAEQTADGGEVSPYFELAHPKENWCSAEADCIQQSPSGDPCGGAFVCSASLCACR